MIHLALLLLWIGAIFAGGWLLVRAAFHLSDSENIFTGMAVGVILETVLASILCRWMPAPTGFYICGALVLVFGGAAAWHGRISWRGFRLQPFLHLIPFGLITLVMYNLARGMGIFDDFAHLPVVSLVAAGDIPPHFPLNRSVQYAYHLFLIYFAGQVSRVGDVFVWSAMDLARSLSFSLAVYLGGFWAARLTRSRMVGWLGGTFIALGGGTRWLLLLFSPSFLESLSKQITLIGSGASSGYSLAGALLSEWRIEGVGKLPIPFAYTNGVLQPGVLSFEGANGMMGLVILLVLLLTCTRRRNWIGGVICAVVISALSLVAEADLLLVFGGWVLISLVWLIRCRSKNLPESLRVWGWIGLAAVLLSLAEGGALLDILLGWLRKGSQNYQSVGFVFSAAPALVSSHLGVLPLFRWQTLLAALCEIGPVLLVIPLLLFRTIKAFKRSAWFEASMLSGYLLTLGSIFIQFEGSTGVRNTSRLYSFLTLALIYFIPLGWNWASGKANWLRYSAAAVCLTGMIGGAVLFASQLPAAQKPIVAPFMSELDAKISKKYWNSLPAGTMVFDPVPYRAVIVFGRAVETGLTWYESAPTWKALLAEPDPVAIHRAGYDYVYLDEEAWNDASGKYQVLAGQACVKPLESEKAWPGVIRKLLDIRACME